MKHDQKYEMSAEVDLLAGDADKAAGQGLRFRDLRPTAYFARR